MRIAADYRPIGEDDHAGAPREGGAVPEVVIRSVAIVLHLRLPVARSSCCPEKAHGELPLTAPPAGLPLPVTSPPSAGAVITPTNAAAKRHGNNLLDHDSLLSCRCRYSGARAALRSPCASVEPRRMTKAPPTTDEAGPSLAGFAPGTEGTRSGRSRSAWSQIGHGGREKPSKTSRNSGEIRYPRSEPIPQHRPSRAVTCVSHS